ncbi:MAG: NADH-quinone oxidoreductase subunit C [Ignavibacteria bacterium]|nr:NADH-quinone oxidoreductase subunit C [Ignavibacteria bacterium]
MTEITDKIKEKLSESGGFTGVIFTENINDPMIDVPKERLLEIIKILKDEFNFDQLRDIVSVDRFTKNERFECIYNLYSLSNKFRIFVKVKLNSKNPEVESLTPLYMSADWAEREAWDMMGIKFLNHPDLRRLYMMEEYEYHPLRKDYPLMGLPGAVTLPKK